MGYGLKVTKDNGYIQVDENSPHFVCTSYDEKRGWSAGYQKDRLDEHPYHNKDIVSLMVKDTLVGNLSYEYVEHNRENEKHLHYSQIYTGSPNDFIGTYRLIPTDHPHARVPHAYGIRIWNEDDQVIYDSSVYPMSIKEILFPPEMKMKWSGLGSTHNAIDSLTGSGWIDYTNVVRGIMPQTTERYYWYAAAYPLPAGTNAVLAGYGHQALTYADEPYGSTGNQLGYAFYQKAKDTYVGVINGHFVVACAMRTNHWYYPIQWEFGYDYSKVWINCMLNFHGSLICCKR